MKQYLLITFFLFSVKLLAQDISYYKKIVDTTQNNYLKLSALDSLISKSPDTYSDTFIAYSLAYIKLATALDSLDAAANKAVKLQNPLVNFKNDSQKAIDILSDLIVQKSKIKDSFNVGSLYLKLGGTYFGSNLEKAIENYSLAIANFGINDSIYVADAYLFRGQAYSDTGQFVPAGQDFNTAYTFYEALKDYEYMAHAQQGNIVMYSYNGFYDKAKAEREKLVAKLEALDLKAYLSSEYFNQSLDYKKLGDSIAELSSLLKARESITPDNIGAPTHIGILSGLIKYYSTHHQLYKAAETLKEIEDYGEIIANDGFAKIYYTGAKATYLDKKGNYNLALDFAKTKLETAEEMQLSDEVADGHLLLSTIYENIGDYKLSLANKNSYQATKDSLYTITSANSLAYYQTLYEIEKSEKQLVSKNADIKLLEKDNKAFRELIIFISVALLLLFGLILLYRNQLHLKKKKILQENFSQELLLSQENERRRISKDLHDGLGQQLLVIKNRLINTGNTNTKTMVDAAINEVRTISRDLHPFQLQELGITNAIKNTLREIDENTPLFISSEIENIDNLFTPEQEINIYRIVQESLSNTLKHANAEASKISVKKLADEVLITIRDNGKGFEFAEKLKSIKSLGLKTLIERTKSLNGQMKVQSKKLDGTLLEFQFPIA